MLTIPSTLLNHFLYHLEPTAAVFESPRMSLFPPGRQGCVKAPSKKQGRPFPHGNEMMNYIVLQCLSLWSLPHKSLGLTFMVLLFMKSRFDFVT